MATAEDYAAWIVKNADKKGTANFETVARAYREAKASVTPSAAQPGLDPSEGEGELQLGPIHTGVRMPQAMTRGLAAAGKAFSDLGTGVQQIGAGVADMVSPRQPTVSDIVLNDGKPISRVDQLRKDVGETRARDKALMDTTAGKVGSVAGNVALFAPTAMIPGANTITGGAAIGALSGLLQPSQSGSETLANTGLGGVFGAAVPAAIRGLQIVKASAEPFYQRGREMIVGRALNRAAGSDAPQVANRLAQAAEYVPGSKPTVGQAAENAGVAALQRAAAATNPEVTTALQEVAGAQNDARVGLLNGLAGTKQTRTAAEAAREAATSAQYEAGKSGAYQVDSTLADLLSRPAVKQAMSRAETMAANEGRPFTLYAPADSAKYVPPVPYPTTVKGVMAEEQKRLAMESSRGAFSGVGGIQDEPVKRITGQGILDLKMALDAMLKDPASGIAGKEAGVVKALRGQIMDWMEARNPAFNAARTGYAAASKPLNQMDVGEELLKSVNPLTGTLQPGSFAKAMRDPNLASRATGFAPATLENTMEPAQVNALEGLLKDVQRSSFAQSAGRGSGSDTVQKLAYSNILDQAGVPTFLRDLAPAQVAGNLTGRVADAAYGSANRELSSRLAMVMLDPKAAAELMKRATPAQKNALLQLVQQAGSGAALAVPAIANAQK